MKTFLLLLVTALALAATAPAADKCAMSCCARPAPPALATYTDKSLFQLDSVWTTDATNQVRLDQLRGRPQVVAMFFASCQFTCPLTINDLKGIEAALPANVRTNVGFTLVSFDSDRDTPKVLRGVRQDRGLGGNWTLLRGGADDVRELAALLGVNFRKDANGQFAHSNLITVLNAEGEIIFQQPGLNLPPDAIVAKLTALFPK